MTSSVQAAGLALLCDEQGLLQQVLLDNLSVASEAQLGRPFTQLIDPAGLGKALSFLADLRARGVAFDWELTVLADSGIRVLHFTGVVTEGDSPLLSVRGGFAFDHSGSGQSRAGPDQPHLQCGQVLPSG